MSLIYIDEFLCIDLSDISYICSDNDDIDLPKQYYIFLKNKPQILISQQTHKNLVDRIKVINGIKDNSIFKIDEDIWKKNSYWKSVYT